MHIMQTAGYDTGSKCSITMHITDLPAIAEARHNVLSTGQTTEHNEARQ